MNKKIIVYAGIGIFVFAGISATRSGQEDPKWKNLKVIPKKIDEDQMERVMHRYCSQLGVTCKYCHSTTDPAILPVRADFASDDKREKIIAREMMIMTDRLNKKYFNYRNDYSFESLAPHPGITCNTCHRGIPKPTNMKLFFNKN
jgi:hypothetical protein